MDDLKYLKMRCFIFVGLMLIICFSLLGIFNVKDYNIMTSSLPQNKLWTIRQAKIIKNKITPDGHHQIENNEALLELIKHAYQWDKNAMTAYAEYLDHVTELDSKHHDKKNLDVFLQKNASLIVDEDRNQLKRPDIFDDTHLLYKKMAEAGYPWASLKEGIAIRPKGGAVSLSPEERKKKIIYLSNALKGGFHSAHELIADAILISAGEDCSGPAFNNLNLLNPHQSGINSAGIQQALNEYKITALHGNSYGMLRLAESYYYGVGVKKNINEAYLWGQMAIFAFNEYQHREEAAFQKNKSYIWYREQMINVATRNILKEIQQELTEKEWSALNKTANTHLAEMITWDYYEWQDGIDPVLPKP